jgi:exodeoxyribonuclease VII small subunit
VSSDEETSTVEEAGKALGFGEAMSELEAILRRVEGEEVDIDRLADELRRAAVLLELCRSKIRRAEVEIAQVVHQLGDREDT